jgi:antitoxin component of MazEF toxin-antitoxin module
MKILKIGGSHFIIVPAEYIKVFNLLDYKYEVSVEKGNIIYKKIGDKNDKNS